MLKAEIDFEVIRSALLAGEVDDAVAWIKKAMRNMEIYRRTTKSAKYDALYRFLQSLMKYLSGETVMEEFREEVHRIPGIRDAFVPHEEHDQFMDSFMYYIRLAVDRYNISYPAFDGKRCDDK